MFDDVQIKFSGGQITPHEKKCHTHKMTFFLVSLLCTSATTGATALFAAAPPNLLMLSTWKNNIIKNTLHCVNIDRNKFCKSNIYSSIYVVYLYMFINDKIPWLGAGEIWHSLWSHLTLKPCLSVIPHPTLADIKSKI